MRADQESKRCTMSGPNVYQEISVTEEWTVAQNSRNKEHMHMRKVSQMGPP